MKTVKKLVLALGLCAAPFAAQAFSTNASTQSATIGKVSSLQQERGRNNTQGINVVQDSTGKFSVHKQDIQARGNVELRQNNGNGNTQGMNVAETKKNAAVFQSTNIRGRLNMKQSGGKNNTQAVNLYRVK